MKQILQDQRHKLSVQSGTEKKSGFLLLTYPYLLPAKQVLLSVDPFSYPGSTMLYRSSFRCCPCLPPCYQHCELCVYRRVPETYP